MNISRISVSRKLVFDECQQRYKYQYHLKTPSPEEEPFYFIYGTIIHKCAEEYVRLKGERTLAAISKDILSGAIPMDDHDGVETFAPPLPAAYKRRYPGHLKSIQRLTDAIGFDGELEYNFRYDLDPPNERCIVGYIDRLFKKGDTWYIIDYKTTKRSKWRKNSRTIVGDLQLRCYARVVQKTFDVPADKIKAALCYLEGYNIIGAQFSERSLESIDDEMLQAYLQIEQTDPDKVWGNVGDHCRRCVYRKLCPFYSLT